MTLETDLLGTWDLESYVEKSFDGSPLRYPFGEDANGRLIYSSDGWMSVQLMAARRPLFASGDWFQGTAEELSAAANYVGYSGRFTVDEVARTVCHIVDISFFPNWIGQVQIRQVTLDSNYMRLSPLAPIRSGGRDVVPSLNWKRSA
jgi:hypothetical protein